MTRHRPPPLGQHFLTRDAIPRLMVEAAQLNADDIVLEIGPGHGILTRLLTDKAKQVIAVEKDERLAAALAAAIGSPAPLTVVTQDFRDWWRAAEHQSILGKRYKIIANLPYYLTGEFFRLVLPSKNPPQTIVVLVQKEVAQRVIGRERESLLSISIKAYGHPRLVKIVKRGQFSPPPKVDSAVLAIDNIARARFPTATAENRFFDILHRGFANPRKMLGGKLPELAGRFAACGLSPQARAETLTLEQWFCLNESSLPH